MKIKLQEKELINDYVKAVTEVEKVLWQGNMNMPSKIVENYREGCSMNGVIIFIGYVMLNVFISAGPHSFIWLLFLSSIIGLIISARFYQKTKRKNKLAHTQYVITNERVIFIIYHEERIGIHSIPFRNIAKVRVNRNYDSQGTIFFILNNPVDFQTYRYWTDQAHTYIAMVQVINPEQVLSILNEQIQKSKP